VGARPEPRDLEDMQTMKMEEPMPADVREAQSSFAHDAAPKSVEAPSQKAGLSGPIAEGSFPTQIAVAAPGRRPDAPASLVRHQHFDAAPGPPQPRSAAGPTPCSESPTFVHQELGATVEDMSDVQREHEMLLAERHRLSAEFSELRQALTDSCQQEKRARPGADMKNLVIAEPAAERPRVVQGALELVAASGHQNQSETTPVLSVLPPLNWTAISQSSRQREREFDTIVGSDTPTLAASEEPTSMRTTSTTMSEAGVVQEGGEEDRNLPRGQDTQFQNLAIKRTDQEHRERYQEMHTAANQHQLEKLILDLGAAAQSERQRRLALEARCESYRSAIRRQHFPSMGNAGDIDMRAMENEEMRGIVREHEKLLSERSRLSEEFSELRQALKDCGGTGHYSPELCGHSVAAREASFTHDPLVAMWLKQLGLQHLCDKFALECIDRASLALLSHSQLQELGVNKMGDRSKLLRRSMQRLV
jgi:hypothetical protein